MSKANKKRWARRTKALSKRQPSRVRKTRA